MQAYAVKLPSWSTRAPALRSVSALMEDAYGERGRLNVLFEQGGDDRAVYGDAVIPRLGAISQRFGGGFA